MCLILHRPSGKTFDQGLFGPAKENNPHGFGIMYPRGDGSVKAIKGMFELETINKIWEAIGPDVEVAAHFRFSTIGEKTKDNCHPFRILSLKEHGRDLFMMHNGTMHQVPRPEMAMSDTWHFVEKYLKPVLMQKPELIDNPDFHKFLDDLVGTNRLLFMDGNGLVTIINQTLGTEKEGCWLSNTYSIRDKKAARANTTQGTLPLGPDARPLSRKQQQEFRRQHENMIHGGRTHEDRARELVEVFDQVDILQNEGGSIGRDDDDDHDDSGQRFQHSMTDSEFRAFEEAADRSQLGVEDAEFTEV